MTFEIRHQPDAEYRLLQFSGPPSLLDNLSHSLRINDRVLRFRIIKVVPGTPPAPDTPPPVIGAQAQGSRRSASALPIATVIEIATASASPRRPSSPSPHPGVVSAP